MLELVAKMAGYDIDRNLYDRDDYGGDSCCQETEIEKLLQVLSLLALGLLIFYLITIFTTTTAERRKKRDTDEIDENELSVDFSTWISLIHNLWTKDGLLDDPRCTYYNLCEMAHLAHKKGGQGEYAAALSTIPLSYLLHSRHQAGFISFSSAAGSGYMGENCSTLYTGCDSLGSY
ncbi:uncharacterized protein LOC136031212 [Artemia franciscana]|uniref:uncharacterized protein LOC136031212 n=1 Tax=Artemia franciscana TaxID=6661 RepID=UPI0032D9CDD8